MKKTLPVLFFLLSFYATFSQTVFNDCVDGQLYVKFKSTALKSILRENPRAIPVEKFKSLVPELSNYNVTGISRPFYQAGDDAVLPYIVQIQFTKKQLVTAFIATLAKNANVEYAEKIAISKTDVVPNDPSFPPHLTQINAANAWNVFNGNSNITVAIVDDAVMWSHADLAANIYVNPGEIAGNNIDDDANGYIDDVRGYDVSDNDNSTIPTQLAMSHGTHCSGIAGGCTNNGIGIASIGWNIKIIPVKCQTNGGQVANISNGYEGIIYAAKAKARVISCSWGSGISMATGQAVVNYAWNKGCLVVAAAGNNSVNSPIYPGAYTHVYCVAAVENNDVKASYSNYGTYVDISAPGSNVNSTIPYTGSPAYTQLSGTSMATPLVAGLAGLMLSKCPYMTAADVINCISSTAVNINNLSGNSSYSGLLGAGRIEAFQAMTCAAGYLTIAPVANFFSSPVVSCSNTPVQFYDSSLYQPTSWSWTFQGGTPATSTASNPVVQWAASGNYNVTLHVSNANGGNTVGKMSYISIVNPIALPLAEGFQASTFLPTNWTAHNIMNDERYWQRKTGIGGFGSSNACAMFDNFTYNTAGDRDEMRTPKYDLTQISTARLRFDVAYARYDFVNSDTLEVKLSTDCGASWTSIYLKGGTSLATSPDQGAYFVPNSAQWRRDSIDVSNLAAGQGNVMFSFINHGQYGQPIYLDNINIALPEPTLAINAPALVCSGVPFSFTNSSVGAGSYFWDLPGVPVGTTSIASPTVSYSSAGDYTVTLVGYNGTTSTSIEQNIIVIESPAVGFTMTPASCITCTDGSLFTTPVAGQPPFTYTWLPTGGNSQQAQNLAPGNYTLLIDGSGCPSTQYVQVSIGTGIHTTTAAGINMLVYPNPAKANVTIELPGIFAYSLFDNLGRLVAQNKMNTNSTLISLDKFSRGVYVLEVKTGADILQKKIIIE